MNDINSIIGRQVKLLGDHPWAGHTAEVVGWDDRLGMRVAIHRGDAMDGHECYVMKKEHFRAIPREFGSDAR